MKNEQAMVCASNDSLDMKREVIIMAAEREKSLPLN